VFKSLWSFRPSKCGLEHLEWKRECESKAPHVAFGYDKTTQFEEGWWAQLLFNQQSRVVLVRISINAYSQVITTAKNGAEITLQTESKAWIITH
jgi:hypothetical protein